MVMEVYPMVIVPRMTRGLPVLVMRGMLKGGVDVKDRSVGFDAEARFNGWCGRWAEIDCNLLNIYMRRKWRYRT
jgi:hypothetical protein